MYLSVIYLSIHLSIYPSIHLSILPRLPHLQKVSLDAWVSSRALQQICQPSISVPKIHHISSPAPLPPSKRPKLDWDPMAGAIGRAVGPHTSPSRTTPRKTESCGLMKKEESPFCRCNLMKSDEISAFSQMNSDDSIWNQDPHHSPAIPIGKVRCFCLWICRSVNVLHHFSATQLGEKNARHVGRASSQTPGLPNCGNLQDLTQKWSFQQNLQKIAKVCKSDNRLCSFHIISSKRKHVTPKETAIHLSFSAWGLAQGEIDLGEATKLASGGPLVDRQFVSSKMDQDGILKKKSMKNLWQLKRL